MRVLPKLIDRAAFLEFVRARLYLSDQIEAGANGSHVRIHMLPAARVAVDSIKHRLGLSRSAARGLPAQCVALVEHAGREEERAGPGRRERSRGKAEAGPTLPEGSGGEK